MLKRKIIEKSKKVIVLADYTKLGKISVEKIIDIDKIDYLITDSKADEKVLNSLRKKTTISQVVFPSYKLMNFTKHAKITINVN